MGNRFSWVDGRLATKPNGRPPKEAGVGLATRFLERSSKPKPLDAAGRSGLD